MIGDCASYLFRKIGPRKLFAFALAILLPATSTGTADLDLARFATAKAHEIRELADTTTNHVPSLVWSFFDAARVDDWETPTNLADRLDLASGRYLKASSAVPLPAYIFGGTNMPVTPAKNFSFKKPRTSVSDKPMHSTPPRRKWHIATPIFYPVMDDRTTRFCS